MIIYDLNFTNYFKIKKLTKMLAYPVLGTYLYTEIISEKLFKKMIM